MPALLSLLAALILVISACGSSTETETQTEGDGTDEQAEDSGTELSSSAADDDNSSDDDSSSDDDTGGQATTDDAEADDNGGSSSDGGDAGTATEFTTIGELLTARGVDANTESSRFDGTLKITGAPGSDLPASFSMTFTGAMDPETKASDVSVDFGEFMRAMAEAEGGASEQEMAMMSAIFDEPLRTVTIGDTAWVQWAFVTMFAGGQGDEWVETDVDGADDFTSEFAGGAFGSSNEALGPFTAAEADIVEFGNETVRGIDTVHYRADVRYKQYYDSLSDEEKAAFDEQYDMGDVAVDSVPVELWIDDGGHIVRMRYSMSDPAMFNDADGVESVEMTIESYDFGADIEITPPPAAEILPGEQLGLDPGA
jgi:hypothetical protein